MLHTVEGEQHNTIVQKEQQIAENADHTEGEERVWHGARPGHTPGTIRRHNGKKENGVEASKKKTYMSRRSL